MTANQIKAIDDSLDTIQKMMQNRDRAIKVLAAVLLLTWIVGGYHIFVQMPKMKDDDDNQA